MEYLFSFLTAELIPGGVLSTAMRATNLHGGARLTTALASIGPGGMTGGLISLGVIQIVSFLGTKGALDAIFFSVVRHLHKEGIPADQILEGIAHYPVSLELKERLRREVTRLSDDRPRIEP